MCTVDQRSQVMTHGRRQHRRPADFCTKVVGIEAQCLWYSVSEQIALRDPESAVRVPDVSAVGAVCVSPHDLADQGGARCALQRIGEVARGGTLNRVHSVFAA